MMKIPAHLRFLVKQVRSILLPMGSLTAYMKRSTQRTASQLGMDPSVVKRLMQVTTETCQECWGKDEIRR